MNEPAILTITDYFLPGYLGGGPIRTLANMRVQLAGKVALPVFTRDRDLGMQVPYPGIGSNQWVDTPEGPVFYACPRTFGPSGLRRALAAQRVDAIYLNSFFSPRASILINLDLRRRGVRLPLLLAPRGEFSPGALAVKRRKKRAFLALSRRLGLYRDIAWHASSPLEAEDILRQFPDARDRIHIAADPVIATPPLPAPDVAPKKPGHLRIAFISRISPKKNLDGLLGVLHHVRASVDLNIFGPVEDAAYWAICEKRIATLPAHITVRMHGALPPDAVSPTFARHDLFAFPTQGENFGHVIFEALRAGTPVLISDQTPWRPDDVGAVTTLPLNDEAGWHRAIEDAATRTEAAQARLRAAASSYATRYASTEGSLQDNLMMFRALVP